jgi:putative hydrolase of the HAD superfamily
MRPRAILFDFGGTLDLDGVHWSDRFFSAYTGAGLALDGARFDRAFAAADRLIARRDGMEKVGLREQLQLQVSLQLDALQLDPDLAAAIVTPLHAESRANLDRAVAVLARLKPRYQLGVVSNFSGNLRAICAEVGLLPLLDVLLDSRVEGRSKPDPRFLALALDRLGREGGECVFVGDSVDRDLVPAKSLGMCTVWLRREPRPPCTDPEAVDFRIATLGELHPILEKVDAAV